jgi:hypothetical protein
MHEITGKGQATTHLAKGEESVDPGLERFATDGPVPTIATGALPGANNGFKGDALGA